MLLRAAVAGWLIAGAVYAGEPVPTVIVDIHGIGAKAVADLKAAQDAGVRWSAEFGNELLLGVDPPHLDRWLARHDTRAGPPRLAFDEVVVRDHGCPLHDLEPALAVVGGSEVLRKPALLAKLTAGPRLPGEPLPADGVVGRELANDPALSQRAKALRGVDPKIAALVARIDRDRWFDTMSALASFDRNSFSPSLFGAHDWIQARFGEAGLQIGSFSYTFSSGSCTGNPVLANPIGIKRGSVTPDEWVVIGAHYDSRNAARCDGTENPSPGANDNASGCAGVIELARAFAQVDTERTMVFTCFSGEEQGLVGSQRYVQSLVDNGDIAKVRHMVNLDMIGHSTTDALPTRIQTNVAQQALLAVYAAAAADHAPELSLITSTGAAANSDHWHFLQQGIPAMFTWENGATGYYPQYHTLNDLPVNMLRARQQAHGILKMDAAVLSGEARLSGLFADGFE